MHKQLSDLFLHILVCLDDCMESILLCVTGAWGTCFGALYRVLPDYNQTLMFANGGLDALSQLPFGRVATERIVFPLREHAHMDS